MAKEQTGLEIRLLKIVELMLSCRFGLTDLTYVKRMNMPLELGLLLAFGNETFVTTAAQYSALRTISDLNFGDIFAHGGRIGRLITGLSRWIEQSTGLKSESALKHWCGDTNAYNYCGAGMAKTLIA